MTTLARVDDLLRDRGGAAPFVSVGIVAATLYGACMSSYAAWTPDRAMMPVIGAAKAPLVLAVTTLVCLPAFWGLCGATGRRDWFSVALRCVAESQAVGAVTLASMGPLVVVLYLSDVSQPVALLANAFAFGVAAIASQVSPWRRLGRATGSRTPPVRLLTCWLLLYAFVGVQVAWMARPVIVPRDEPFAVFRDDPLTNGYVALARLARAAVSGEP